MDSLGKIINLILPPRCIATDEIVGEQGSISPKYWPLLNFSEKPLCEICGQIFEFHIEDGMTCATCIDKKPHFDMARSALIYDDFSSKMILKFKHGDKQHASISFAKWMLRAGSEFINSGDIIAPVPLHRFRLFKRKFNQSGILASEIAKYIEAKPVLDLIIRQKHTPPQKGLNAEKRRKNVARAFIINPKYKDLIKGKNIIIIDDVYTSGATLNECSKLLKTGKADKIFCLTIAQTKQSQ